MSSHLGQLRTSTSEKHLPPQASSLAPSIPPTACARTGALGAYTLPVVWRKCYLPMAGKSNSPLSRPGLSHTKHPAGSPGRDKRAGASFCLPIRPRCQAPLSPAR